MMRELQLEILQTKLLPQFCEEVTEEITKHFDALSESKLSVDTFSFYTSISAVFSSKIEGEEIELDSFIKHKLTGANYLPDFTQKVDDLYTAYEFAQNNPLTEGNISEAHVLITEHILHESQRGQLRTGNMFVVTKDARIEYVACEPDMVSSELRKLYRDIRKLLTEELDIKEVLYFAAYIHLVFVKIHPFNDGNGRTARLLEKWFLAEKLGAQAWFLQSEKMYYDQHDTYYKNIRLLGLEYPELNYEKALPFLKMLVSTLNKD